MLTTFLIVSYVILVLMAIIFIFLAIVIFYQLNRLLKSLRHTSRIINRTAFNFSSYILTVLSWLGGRPSQ